MGCPGEEVGGSRCDALEDGSAGDGVEGVGDIDLAEKPSRGIWCPRDEGLDGEAHLFVRGAAGKRGLQRQEGCHGLRGEREFGQDLFCHPPKDLSDCNGPYASDLVFFEREQAGSTDG